MIELVKKPSNIETPNSISCSITWIDGRLLFKPEAKHSMLYYGICSYSKRIFAVTPRDYEKPLMITTIYASIVEEYCDRGRVCLDFKCPLNRFKKDDFLFMFKDAGSFTLGLPQNFGEAPLFFSEYPYAEIWEKFIIPITGGVLRFNPDGNPDGKVVIE